MTAKVPPEQTGARKPSRVWGTLRALARTRIIAGLITVMPIYITILLLRFVFGIMRDASQWVVYGVLHGRWVEYLPKSWGFEWEGFTPQELESRQVQWSIAIFSVILTVCILYAIGVFTANMIGARLLALFEKFISRVPLAKTVYHASKQILSTFTNKQSTSFQKVVLIPFPSNEVRSIGFITGASKDATTGDDLCTVFLASTPNPTTGFVFVLKRNDLVELDWNIEETVKIVMSGGILIPEVLPSLGSGPAATTVVRPSKGGAH